MAVNLDDSQYFKFVIISDKSKPSKKKFTEKPSKDKDNMSSIPPPDNNEKSIDEKNKNSQETDVPEVKVNDSPNNVDGESTKEQTEQKNEEKLASASHSVQNLSIEVPSKVSPQIVTSPSEITRARTPELSTSPISPQNSNIFKKIGNMIRNSPDNGAASNTIPEQREVTTSDSEVQTQQEQQIADKAIANNNNAENTANAARFDDENRKEDDKKVIPETAVKQRTSSLSANVKSFITRTSSVFVGKLKEEFDNLDKRIYPDIDPDWAENHKSSRDISERVELSENKDISKGNEVTNGTSQKSQSTQDVLADVGVALNERKEKLENIGERTEELSNHAASFAEIAAQIRKREEQKSRSWKIW